ncbi:MAG: cysteine desulfurase family protein [Thermodesulfovibrionales bacterium]
MIYLDNNASTHPDPEVSDAVFSALRREYGNASSGHAAGRRARDLVESSRAAIAGFLGCLPEELFFVSGGTEANNLAILGCALAAGRGHVVTSSIEHPSVLGPCRRLASSGFSVSEVAVDRHGVVRIDELKQAVRKDTVLISVMHANNETGVLQPIAEIGMIAKEKGVLFHVDAAQSIGKTPFSLAGTDIDLLTVAPHKFYGPKGIGGLFIRSGTKISPLFFGAGHERGLRPGTENVPAIAGFAKACQLAQSDLKKRVSHTQSLRDLLLSLLGSGLDGVRLNGHPEHRLPNTLNVSIPGVPADRLLALIGGRVAASSGSACHAGSTVPSPVLKQMGLSDGDALSSVRFSVGKDNTEDEVREAARIVCSAASEIRKNA